MEELEERNDVIDTVAEAVEEALLQKTEADPIEVLLEKMVRGEMPPVNYNELELGIGLLSEELSVEETGRMLLLYSDENRISPEMYEALLLAAIRRGEKKAAVLEEKKEELKPLSEFVRSAFSLLKERDNLARIKAAVEKIESEKDPAEKIALASVYGFIEPEETAELLRKRKNTQEKAAEKILAVKKSDIEEGAAQYAVRVDGLREELRDHPEMTEFRRRLQQSILEKAFEPEKKQKDVPRRIDAVYLLFRETDAKLIENLFLLAKTLYQKTGYRMGGYYGPTPHIANIFRLRNEASAFLKMVSVGEPSRAKLEEAAEEIERFLMAQRRIDKKIKERIAKDWALRDAEQALEEMTANLADYYKLLPELLRVKEAEKEQKIKEEWGVEKVDERIKALYDLEESALREEKRLVRFMEEVLGSDASLFDPRTVRKFITGIASAGAFLKIKEAAARIESGELPEKEALPLILEFSEPQVKAQVFELQAQQYEDEARDIEEEIRKRRIRGKAAETRRGEIARYLRNAELARGRAENLRLTEEPQEDPFSENVSEKSSDYPIIGAAA